MMREDGELDEEAIAVKVGALMDDVQWVKGTPPATKKFVTKSRRVRIFSDVNGNEQPACFQAEYTTTEAETTGMPGKTLLEFNWIIYFQVNDPKAIGATELNSILKAVRTVLKPKPSDEGFPKRNTLDGLVHHLYIGGKIFKDPGDIDGQGMLVVPIKILVPS